MDDMKELMDNIQEAGLIDDLLPDKLEPFCETEDNFSVYLQMPQEGAMEGGVVCSVNQLDDLLALTEAHDKKWPRVGLSWIVWMLRRTQVRNNLLCLSKSCGKSSMESWRVISVMGRQ